MTEFVASGRCLCGAVAYRVTAPAKSLEHCHCSICRRAHGALSAAAALVDTTEFHLESGRDRLRSFTSSPGSHRWFCGDCGCQIYIAIDRHPDEIYYWAASLDEGAHPGHPPERECRIFVGSKAAWDRFDETVPAYDGFADTIGLGSDENQNGPP